MELKEALGAKKGANASRLALKVIRKGKVEEVRVKPSDAMLRLLLAGAAPGKYGRYAGPPAAKDRQPDGEAPGKWSYERSFAKLEKSLEVYRLRRAREPTTARPDGVGAGC